MNSGGGQEGRVPDWFDRFLGRPDPHSVGEGSGALAFGSSPQASGQDILILSGGGWILRPRPSDPCCAKKKNFLSYPLCAC